MSATWLDRARVQTAPYWKYSLVRRELEKGTTLLSPLNTQSGHRKVQEFRIVRRRVQETGAAGPLSDSTDIPAKADRMPPPRSPARTR